MKRNAATDVAFMEQIHKQAVTHIHWRIITNLLRDFKLILSVSNLKGAGWVPHHSFKMIKRKVQMMNLLEVHNFLNLQFFH